MRRLGSVGNTAGVLATAALLLLLSPGVKVVRAEGAAAGAQAAASGGSQCEAAAGPRTVDAQLEAFLAEIRREQFARAVEGDESVPIMLNNRGYNYGPPPGLQLDPVLAEALRRGR
jgi:hypothetical protein